MKFASTGLGLIAAVMFGTAAHAAANLVTNGGFDAPLLPASIQMTANNVPGWTNGTDANGIRGYNFVFKPGTADTTGAYTPQYNSQVILWGPHNTTAPNTMPANDPFGTGGNFIAADGAFEQAPISQTISGLTIGQDYIVSFDWAAGQQYSFTGATTEWWNVSFDAAGYNAATAQKTATVTTPSQGFTPWTQTSMTFRATATTEVLSFLAGGTPSGVPPFSLLDNVSLFAAPEPASWALMLMGLTGIAAAVRFRKTGVFRRGGAAQA